MAKLLYFDTETTGLIPNLHGMIQIAGCVEIDGKVTESFNYKCQPFPTDKVEEKALEVNNITTEDLLTFPPPSEVFKELKALFKRYVDPFKKGKLTSEYLIPVGYRIEFDLGMLEAFFKKNNDTYIWTFIKRNAAVDVLALLNYWCLTSENLDLFENRKLSTVISTLFPNLQLDFHDALTDIRMTYKLHRWLKNAIQNGIQRIGPTDN